MKIVWKVSRGRSSTAHAYELPFSFKRGQALISLCRKRETTFLSEHNEEGSRCRICERKARHTSPTSGDIDVC